MDNIVKHIEEYKNIILDILKSIGDFKINTPLYNSLVNTINISFKNINSIGVIKNIKVIMDISSGPVCNIYSNSLS